MHVRRSKLRRLSVHGQPVELVDEAFCVLRIKSYDMAACGCCGQVESQPVDEELGSSFGAGDLWVPCCDHSRPHLVVGRDILLQGHIGEVLCLFRELLQIFVV